MSSGFEQFCNENGGKYIPDPEDAEEACEFGDDRIGSFPKRKGITIYKDGKLTYGGVMTGRDGPDSFLVTNSVAGVAQVSVDPNDGVTIRHEPEED